MSMRYERTRAYLPRDAHPTVDGPAGSIKSDSAADRSVSQSRSRTIKIASGILGTSEITNRSDVMPEFAIFVVFLLAAFAISRLV